MWEGLRIQPENQIGAIIGLMFVKKSAEAAQQFWGGQFFGEDQASMGTIGFLPFLSEKKEVLEIEGHQGSAFGRGKIQLLDIGQSEISSLLGRQAIHSVRRQCGAEDNWNVLIQIQLHE